MSATIQSYVVHPLAGRAGDVAAALSAIPWCEIVPAQNGPILVLVTETPDRAAQRELEKRLEALENIANIALVSGWTDHTPKEEVA